MKTHVTTSQPRSRELRHNVAQLLQELTGAQRRYSFEVESPFADGSLELTSPLKGIVTFTRTSQGVLVEARVQTTVRLPCDRCLEPTEYPLDVEWSEEFHPSVDVLTGRHLPVELDDLDEAVVIDDHHILDLTETIRQHLLLALPSHPLCREDCAGLCPQCGANLNQESCTCSTEPADPRWARLADLLKRMETGEAA